MGQWARPGWGDLIDPNPTDRGKRWVKRSVLVEADGGPLSVVIAGTNVHGTKLSAQTLEAVVVERPAPTPEQPQHLCLDKAYDNPIGKAAVAEHGYVGHIRRIGEEKRDLATLQAGARHAQPLPEARGRSTRLRVYAVVKLSLGGQPRWSVSPNSIYESK
jgi:hypothetical protein